MTVDDVLFALGAAFPSFNAKALGVWGPGLPLDARKARRHAPRPGAGASARGLRSDEAPHRLSGGSDYLAQLPDFSRDLAKAAAGSAALRPNGPR